MSMEPGHDHEVDMLGLVREEQRRWWRLSFMAEEVEWAERHLSAEVVDARDAGWSWRRLGAATGIPAETLRQRHERLEAAGLLPCGSPRPARTGPAEEVAGEPRR